MEIIMGIIKKTVRILRKRQTTAEQELWQMVRRKSIAGKRFQRQYPIKYTFHHYKSFFVADFYCHEHKLIIEIDGEIHKQTRERDQLRDSILQELGYTVLRFTNEEVFHNKQYIIQKLNQHALKISDAFNNNIGLSLL